LKPPPGPGGKLNLLELDGYRYDLGPSLFTLPHLVTGLFELAGRNPEDYFRYKPVPLACKYFWGDDTVVEAWVDRERFAEEIRDKLGVDKRVVTRHIDQQIKLYDAVAPVFLENSLHKASTFFSRKLLRAGMCLPNIALFSSMNTENERILKHPKLIQLFNRMATYNGSDPYQAPGILNIISSLEHGSGVFFPDGGMYSITLALVRLAEELGVNFRYNEKVVKINHDKKQVTSVDSDLNTYPAQVVISNADVVPTYRNLLPDFRSPEKSLAQERSSSALVFYWGMDREFPELELHNIFFSKNYKDEFTYLFRKKMIFEDPTVYINISAKENKADAPRGHENWFVMVNAPWNDGQDWKTLIRQTKQNILRKVSVILQTDVNEHIRSEYILDPPGIESKTSSYRGSLYGTSSNSRYSAFLRHPNFTSRLKGLYFTGGSVHPGGRYPPLPVVSKNNSRLN
jgi:diapolycopene oxygenase